jgi:AraC-like DNA-binding protein
VLAVLIEHADLLLSRLPRSPDLIERTRRAIGERLRGGDPSLESVARELGMSERSLQRHLRELGCSYNALADEVREATARLYLEQPDIALARSATCSGSRSRAPSTAPSGGRLRRNRRASARRKRRRRAARVGRALRDVVRPSTDPCERSFGVRG